MKQTTSTGLTRTEKDHEKVNKNIFEICFLLKLLNNEYDLELKKPSKQSNQTLQFLRLKAIHFENESIDIEEFLKRRCEEFKTEESKNGIKQQTIDRRTRRFKDIDYKHLLIDILEQLAYSFELCVTRSPKRLNKSNGKDYISIESIESVSKDQTLFIRDDIDRIGFEFHNCCMNFIKQNEVLIPKKEQ